MLLTFKDALACTHEGVLGIKEVRDQAEELKNGCALRGALGDGEAAETACAGPCASGAEALAQRGEVAPDSGIVEVFIAEIRMRGWCGGQSGDKENGFDYWVSESGSFTYFAIRWRRLHEGPKE